MKSFRLAALAPLAILAGLAVPLAAQGGPGCQGMGRMQRADCPGPRMESGIPDLTTEQRTRLDAIRTRHDAALTAKGRSARDAGEDFAKLSHDPDASESALQAASQKAASARLALILERRALVKEEQEVLTPEQRATLKDRMAWHGGGMAMGRGPRHHGGMGHEPMMGPLWND